MKSSGTDVMCGSIKSFSVLAVLSGLPRAANPLLTRRSEYGKHRESFYVRFLFLPLWHLRNHLGTYLGYKIDAHVDGKNTQVPTW